jgi:hypothetical protein
MPLIFAIIYAAISPLISPMPDSYAIHFRQIANTLSADDSPPLLLLLSPDAEDMMRHYIDTLRMLLIAAAGFSPATLFITRQLTPYAITRIPPYADYATGQLPADIYYAIITLSTSHFSLFHNTTLALPPHYYASCGYFHYAIAIAAMLRHQLSDAAITPPFSPLR